MKCEICKQRRGILKFAQSMMDFTHGFTQKICRPCYIKILEGTIKNCEKSLKKQKELLKNETK